MDCITASKNEQVNLTVSSSYASAPSVNNEKDSNEKSNHNSLIQVLMRMMSQWSILRIIEKVFYNANDNNNEINMIKKNSFLSQPIQIMFIDHLEKTHMNHDVNDPIIMIDSISKLLLSSLSKDVICDQDQHDDNDDDNTIPI